MVFNSGNHPLLPQDSGPSWVGKISSSGWPKNWRMDQHHQKMRITGWWWLEHVLWFGTWILCLSIQLGISYSHLTYIFFRWVGIPPITRSVSSDWNCGFKASDLRISFALPKWASLRGIPSHHHGDNTSRHGHPWRLDDLGGFPWLRKRLPSGNLT